MVRYSVLRLPWIQWKLSGLVAYNEGINSSCLGFLVAQISSERGGFFPEQILVTFNDGLQNTPKLICPSLFASAATTAALSTASDTIDTAFVLLLLLRPLLLRLLLLLLFLLLLRGRLRLRRQLLLPLPRLLPPLPILLPLLLLLRLLLLLLLDEAPLRSKTSMCGPSPVV